MSNRGFRLRAGAGDTARPGTGRGRGTGTGTTATTSPSEARAAAPSRATTTSRANVNLSSSPQTGHQGLPQAPRRQRPQRLPPPQAGSASQNRPDGQHSSQRAPHPFRLNRSFRDGHSRLSYPLNSEEDSDSDPDQSALNLARAATGAARAPHTSGSGPRRTGQEEAAAMSDDESLADDTSVEDQLLDDDDTNGVLPEDVDDEIEDFDGSLEGQGPEGGEAMAQPVALADPASLGLKEISNLGKFTVSSHKQGNGVDELRSDDVNQYWQSDGPQPHNLTVYFVKRVGIREIRFFVDYSEDESYTPTKIVFKSGTSENNLIEFATMALESPVGWQQVPISGAGGDPDGNTLVSYVLQMQILENHQNGKDTHLRGIKIYAFDGDAAHVAPPPQGETAMKDVAELDPASEEGISRMAEMLASMPMLMSAKGESLSFVSMKEPELR